MLRVTFKVRLHTLRTHHLPLFEAVSQLIGFMLLAVTRSEPSLAAVQPR